MVDHHHAIPELSDKERAIVENPAGFCPEIQTTNDVSIKHSIIHY